MSQQVAVITGASRGLGEAIARKLVEHQFKVVINYVQSQMKADAIVRELGEDKAIAIQADVTNKESVENMVKQVEEKWGRIDVVINNALVNFKFDPTAQAAVENLTWVDYQQQLEGSVKASLHTIQASLPSLKKSTSPRIIQIGTNLFQNPVVPYHQYTTAKAALLGFTRNMAKDLGQYGVTVNMVSGGLLEQTDASSVTTPEVFQLIADSSAIHRVTTPEDVAETVAFLASPQARAITGQNIVVDHGLTMN